jgi:Protein of unknown function (DUF3631)
MVGMKYAMDGTEIPETAEELEALELARANGRPSSDAASVNVLPQQVLANLLDDVERFACRFVAFQNADQSAAVALWVAHCYAIGAAPSAAYLRITSAVEESGKTTLLEVLELLLGAHALNLVSATPAFVFRHRDKVGAVALLLDEIDNTLRDRKDDGARDLLALVNAGYRRSAKVGRTVGRDHEGRHFKAFGPCAIAGLGTLAATTESRCIPIALERKDKGSGERWLPFLVESSARSIADRLEAWASEATVDLLRAVRPAIPSELRDRHVEGWWGLFAIAELAGEGWPARARAAAVGLHTGRDAEDSMSLSVLLLSHIRRVFVELAVDRVATAELLRALVDLEEGPWARWWAADVEKAERLDGPPPRKAGADLSHKLKPFRKPDGKPIKPHVIKLGEGTTARGYLLEDFADAFLRYLGPPGVTNVTNVTPLASTVTSVTSVSSGDQQGDERPPLHPPCPECGSAWFHGHAEGCSRSVLKEER